MEDGGPTAMYILFFVFLLFGAILYGFGEAVKELSLKELSEAAEDVGNKKAVRLYTVADRPSAYVNTVQFFVTGMQLLTGTFFWKVLQRDCMALCQKYMAGKFADTINEETVSVAVFVVTGIVLLYIILTFGVLLPKKLGIRFSDKWANAFVNPIYFLTKLVSPFTGLVSATCKGIMLMFGVHGDDESEDVTEEEIISMVNEGHEQGVLLATEAEMITNIFEFGDKEARDIMTHRKNIIGIDVKMSLGEALDYMLSESRSRYPVYEENIDKIIGILHLRDVMRAHRNADDLDKPVGMINGLIREPLVVPETKNIDDLFKKMQQDKLQMVIVIDEYGQTAGLVAMEDILEEIVGNIMDEYDEDEEYIEETGNANEYIIEGITPLEELEEKFDVSFEEQEFETLNGFLIAKMDRIPEENEDFSVEVGNYEFKILTVENRMIKSVLVTKKDK